MYVYTSKNLFTKHVRLYFERYTTSGDDVLNVTTLSLQLKTYRNTLYVRYNTVSPVPRTGGGDATAAIGRR